MRMAPIEVVWLLSRLPGWLPESRESRTVRLQLPSHHVQYAEYTQARAQKACVRLRIKVRKATMFSKMASSFEPCRSLVQPGEPLFHLLQQFIAFTERKAHVITPDMRVFRPIKRLWRDASHANLFCQIARELDRCAIEHI